MSAYYAAPGADPALPGCPMGRTGPVITVFRVVAGGTMKLTFCALISDGARKYPAVISKDATYCTGFNKVSQ